MSTGIKIDLNKLIIMNKRAKNIIDDLSIKLKRGESIYFTKISWT